MSTIPLFPLGRALFPDGVLQLRVFEVRYLDMIRRCIADNTEFGVVLLLEGAEVRTPEGRETLATIGTMARIDDWHAPMPALIHLRCTGTSRFQLMSARQEKYGLWTGDAQPLPPSPSCAIPAPLQASADALGKLIAQMQQQEVPTSAMPIGPPFRLDECGWVANRWCELLPLPSAQKQRLLAMQDPVRKLEKVYDILARHGLL